MNVAVLSDMRFSLDGAVLRSEAQVTGAMKALSIDSRARSLTLVGRPLREDLARVYEHPLPDHVSLEKLPDWSRMQAFARAGAVARSVRRATRGRDRLVVFMPTFAGTLALVAAALPGGRAQPVVVVVRGSLTQTLLLQPRIAASRALSLAVGAFGRLSRWLVSRADTVVCVSRSLADEVRAPGALTAPEVDWQELRHRPTAAAERQGVLYLGRLEPEKGVDVVVDAALGDEGSAPLPLTVVGGGSLYGDLERRVASAGARGVVRFTGPLDRGDVFDQLTRAKVVVVPSRSEGFGLAALEAAMCGARVLYSPVGGLPEALSWSSGATAVAGHDWRVWRRSMQEALAAPSPPPVPDAEEVRAAQGWSKLEDVVFSRDGKQG